MVAGKGIKVRWETALFAHNLFDKLGEVGDLQPEGAAFPAARHRHSVKREF
jgi:hypothetical protein